MIRFWYDPRGKVGVYYGPKYPGHPSEGWIASTTNYEKGFFDSKEDAEMALLKMMLSE